MSLMITSSPVSKLPPNQRPGSWGWFDEETIEKGEVQRSQPEPEPIQRSEGTFISFNNVQIIENTTTQADTDANAKSEGSISFANPLTVAENVFTKVDPLVNITTKAAEATAEVASDVFDIFKQVAGTGEYAAKAPATEKSQKKAEEEQKLKAAQMRIKEFQMQVKEAKQIVQIAEKKQIEQTMARTGVSQHEVMSYEGSLTIANIFWVAVEKSKHHAKKIAKKMVPGSGRGKSKGGPGAPSLTMNLSAQEGQSMVSSSGSIASAG